MTKEEFDLLVYLYRLLDHMQVTIRKNHIKDTLNYSLTTFESILADLEDTLNNQKSQTNLEFLLTDAFECYQQMFEPQAELHDLYLWDSDLTKRKQKNKDFEHLKQEINQTFTRIIQVCST